MEEEQSEGKRIQAVFFQYENGTQPVREWLVSLAKEDRKIIGGAIGAVEFEWPVGPPLVKKVGKVWEVRTIVATGWARVFFVVDDSKMVLLHGVIKKSKNVSQHDKDVTLKRLGML